MLIGHLSKIRRIKTVPALKELIYPGIYNGHRSVDPYHSYSIDSERAVSDFLIFFSNNFFTKIFQCCRVKIVQRPHYLVLNRVPLFLIHSKSKLLTLFPASNDEIYF